MTGLILTRPNQAGSGGTGGIDNAFETLVLDSGTLTAVGADTLNIVGGKAITTTGTGSPQTVTIDVDPSEINLGELGDVDPTGLADGYVLVYRSGSPSGWVVEPSTTTDEFVRASGTDTTTGHLGDKLAAGSNISLTTLNPAGNEQVEISWNASLGELDDVALGSPVPTGYILRWNGASWVAVDPSFIDTTLNLAAGPGIDITTGGSPEVKTISLDVCSLPAIGSPSTLDVTDTVAVCDGGNNVQVTIEQLGNVLNIITNQIFDDMRDPTGHVNRTDSTVSFNEGTRTFTIQPTTTSFRYYIHGVPFDITTPKSITLPNATGSYFIYFDTDEELHYQSAFTEMLIMDYAYTTVVIWNAAPATGTSNLVYWGDERHGITMDGSTHYHFHETLGTQLISGFALSGLNPDVGSPVDADVQFAVENGVIRDEDLEWFIRDDATPPVENFDLVQDLQSIANIPVLFRDTGGSEWNITTPNNFPLIYSDGVVFTGGSGLPPYNAESGGSWTLQEVANNSYFLVHYLATNDRNNPIVAIQGLTNYNNRPAGRAQALVEFGQLAGLPFEEFVPIATVIYEARTTYSNTPKVRAVTTSSGDDYIDWRTSTFSSTTGGGSASDHGALSGLQDDDHPQYTTDAYDSITDGTNTETATGRSNAIKVEGSGGVSVTVGQTGSPAVDTVSIGFAQDLSMSLIDGQHVLTYVDDTRGVAGKRLSVAEQTLIFSENQLSANDWFEIGNAVDTTTGFVANFPGTIVHASVHCANGNGNTKELHVFVNGVDAGSIGTVTGGTDTTLINNTIDVDFTQGDKIRLQAQQGSGGAIDDTVVKLTLKWRG